MHIVLWLIAGFIAWGLFGYTYCFLFIDDEEEDEYEECPYD